MTERRAERARARRPIPAAVVVAVAAVLSLPAVVPLLVHNDCAELVVRSALRDKSHYHHIDDPADPRSERSILVRGCITKARNRIWLSAIELTPVVVGAVWLLFLRPRDGTGGGSGGSAPLDGLEHEEQEH